VPRASIPEYAMAMAMVAASRSEDPYLKVGAVALSEDNRILSTGYNGLMAGCTPPAGFWDDREARTPYVIHAEINALALVKRGEVHTLAVTTCPCAACTMAILAHGVKRVIYKDEYARDTEHLTKRIFDFYGVQLLHL
jgi:dCMP deaminase